MKKNNSHHFVKPSAASIGKSFFEALFAAAKDPTCVLDRRRKFVYANRSMEQLISPHAELTNKTLTDLNFPANITEYLQQCLTNIFDDCKPNSSAPSDGYTFATSIPLNFTWKALPGEDGSIQFVIGSYSTSDRDSHLENKDRQAFLLKLSDALGSLSDPMLIQQQATELLGEHLRVDRVFYARMDEASQCAMVEHDYVRRASISLIGKQRYADFGVAISVMQQGKPFIAENVEKVPELEPELANYKAMELISLIATPLIKEGEMVACMAITCCATRHWDPTDLLLLEETAERTWSAVERARFKAELQESRALLATVFESLPVGVCFIKNDGTVALSNKEVFRYIPNGQLPSSDEENFKRWRGWDKDDHLIERNDAPGARALRGENVLPGIEMLYLQEDGTEVWTQVSSVPFRDATGQIIGQISVFNDIDNIKRTTEALRQSEIEFRTFVAASSDLVYHMSADWQQMHVLSGKAVAEDGIKKNGKWMDLFIPEEEQPRMIAAIEDAIKQKKMFEMEHQNLQIDGSIGWRHSRAIPVFDGHGEIKEWLGTASDITLRKTAEYQLQELTTRLEGEVQERTAELKESRDQLQSIFDTTLLQMSILVAIRDEHNEIVDLEIKFANHELERETGRKDLVGKRYASEYPGIRKTALFEHIVKAINTGIPQQYEYFYPFEGFNKWYSCMFVKLNDGVVATNMDVSDRKQAEEERFKNYLLLQQSEDMVLLGSWDFNLLTGIFTWSDGMYRLFSLEKGTEISPEIYLSYTTASGRDAAQRVVHNIREGKTDFSETLEIKVNDRIKTLQLKATVVRNDEGNAVKVLGVDLDVSASRLANEKIRKMEETQRQEIFRATLSSQEEERRRISESLHNGLAQTLYAVKISLSSLTEYEATHNRESYIKSKSYTDSLLKDAIDESRRISHQLMPSVLEDFGLETAINDVCKQLSDRIKFRCTCKGLEPRADKYLELAIFRTVQELILNVAKHSGGTDASINVSLNETQVNIEVRDNGRGMQNNAEAKGGIGLTSIRSKVKLLNGQVNIQSKLDQGTTVTIQIPVDANKEILNKII